jgi:uncharacterized membrane protein YfcA
MAATLFLTLIPMAALGAALGFLGGLFGIGGGIVAIPVLVLGLAQSLALGLVTPSALVALATYAGNQRVDWPVGLALAGGGALTVAAGVAVAHAWPERLLRRLFGWMLAASALWLLLGRT